MADVAKSGFSHLKWLEPLAVVLTPQGGRPLVAEAQIDYAAETIRAEFQPTRSIGRTVYIWQIVADVGPMWHGRFEHPFVITGDFVLTFGPDDVPERVVMDAADATWPAAGGDAWGAIFTSGRGQIHGREVEFRGERDGRQVIRSRPFATVGECSHSLRCVHNLCAWCATCTRCQIETRPAMFDRLIEPRETAPRKPNERPIFKQADIEAVTLGDGDTVRFSNEARVSSDGTIDWDASPVQVQLIDDPCTSGHDHCGHGRCINCEDCAICESLIVPISPSVPF